MTDLKNKVAIVTGSARGIGKSIALRYAAKGANVVVNYSRDKESADETVREIAALGVRVIGVRANVANLGEIGSNVSRSNGHVREARHRGCKCWH